MTKEQMINHLRIMRSGVKRAINCIENLKELSEEDKKDRAILKVQLEAFNMAMELLEQQPSDDCVSRQAVLDMATTIQTDDYSGNEILDVIDVDDVKALPPVTPTKCIATVKFSKEDLRDICNERIESTHGTCKDCRWLTTDEDGNYYCEQTGYFDSLDFYCKDFERRGDENEAD
jgi:hypothetical protein